MNIDHILRPINTDAKKKHAFSTKDRFVLILSFLPLYIVSTVFRITTFVLLFTYLNVWTFCPMILSWILNLAYAQRRRKCYEKRDIEFAHQKPKFLLAATTAVFIPLCIVHLPSGKKFLEIYS